MLDLQIRNEQRLRGRVFDQATKRYVNDFGYEGSERTGVFLLADVREWAIVPHSPEYKKACSMYEAWLDVGDMQPLKASITVEAP